MAVFWSARQAPASFRLFPNTLQADELFRGRAERLFFYRDADATFSASYTRPHLSMKGQEDAFILEEKQEVPLAHLIDSRFKQQEQVREFRV